MRRLLLLALLALATPALAVPGTCVVTRTDVVGTFPFGNVGGAGVAFAVDVDPATGRFVFQRDAWPTQFPGAGLQFPTGFGPNGYVGMAPGTVEGTIDGNGVVVLPAFAMTFGTDFQGDVVSLPLNPTLSSGVRVGTRSPGENILLIGQPMQPDGTVHMLGVDILNLVIVNLTGPGITCRLNPVPDLSLLPAGPSLASVRGKGKLGADPALSDDEITLTATVVNGATPFDGSGDLVLRFANGTGTVLALLVRGGSFQTKGKKLTATDTDGSAIEQAFEVRSASQDALPVPPKVAGGKVTIKRAKKRTTVVVSVQGVDLSGLTGALDVSLSLGTQTAYGQTTATAGKKGPKLR